MSLSIGLVGLPNSGKSTLFNALIGQHKAEVASHPFTTINPNIGVIEVPDERLTLLAQKIGVTKTIPASLKIFDIAGLVRGAHQGQGLGNQFLSEINRVDLIALVIRFFENINIPHPENNLHPGNDLQTILQELMLKDLATLKKAREKFKREPKILKSILQMEKLLNEEKMPDSSFHNSDLSQLVPLLTLKPMILIANCSEPQLAEAEELAQKFCPGKKGWICLDALAETQIIDLDDDERQEYRQTLGLGPEALELLITNCFRKLNLISFFTFNQKEVRAWPIEKGLTARQCSGKIHQDFPRLFIRAQVTAWPDFLKGAPYQTKGEHYPVQDGDIIKFILNKT